MQHDKELIIKRFTHSLESYNTIATVQAHIAERLVKHIALHCFTPKKGIEIGSGTGFLTSRLVSLFPDCQWVANDIVKQSQQYLPLNVEFITGDGEFIEIADNQDIIASSSTIQWFDDLQCFIEKTSSKLADNGIIALSTFGPDNFKEILQTTGQGLTYPTILDISNWLSDNKLTILEAEQWEETLKFDSALAVLHHLRRTGVNALESTTWTKSKLQNFERQYQKEFPEFTLTFQPIIVIAQKSCN